MKFLKRFVAALAICILISLLTFWGLAKSISPKTINDFISAQLSRITNQPTQINGNITWQLFPRPAIKITQVQIGDAEKQSNYSVQLKNLFFNLKLAPLLRGQLVFNEVNVDGFQIFINPETKNASPAQGLEKPVAQASTETSFAEQFAIKQILLSGGQVVVKQGQKTTTFSNLQIGALECNLNKRAFPLQFKTELSIRNEDKLEMKALVNFKGNLALSKALISKPLLALQEAPVNGQLAVENLQFAQLKINKINANLKTKAGKLILNPLTLTLYQGESVGFLSYEFNSKKLLLNQAATNLNGSKLSQDLLQNKWFQGSLDFSLHTQTNLEAQDWLNNTSGKGNLTIKDGLIQSFNLNTLLDEFTNKINQSKALAAKDKNQSLLQLNQFSNPDYFKGSTAFKLLTFQFGLHEGRLQSNSFILQADRLQLKGDGELNLSEKSLDARLLATASLNDPKFDKIQQLLGGSFPLLVKGSLTKPIILPDLNIINPILAKFWLKETLTLPVKQLHQQIKTLLPLKKQT